jgi:hypothetical protein
MKISHILAAALSLLPLHFSAVAATAESAKHAINQKGTGSNNGKVSCDVVRKYPNKHPDLMSRCSVDSNEATDEADQVNRSKSNLKDN